jgi:hypothetical protein
MLLKQFIERQNPIECQSPDGSSGKQRNFKVFFFSFDYSLAS